MQKFSNSFVLRLGLILLSCCIDSAKETPWFKFKDFLFWWFDCFLTEEDSSAWWLGKLEGQDLSSAASAYWGPGEPWQRSPLFTSELNRVSFSYMLQFQIEFLHVFTGLRKSTVSVRSSPFSHLLLFISDSLCNTDPFVFSISFSDLVFLMFLVSFMGMFYYESLCQKPVSSTIMNFNEGRVL